MVHINYFETQAAHDAVYNGDGYREPWVALTEQNNLITFNKKIDYRNIVGSIAYFDGRRVKFTSKDAWASSLGTPIGVVVIPASHMQDGKCRVMSLCNMSYVTPSTGTLGTGNDNASTNGTNLMWGVYNNDISQLTNYQSIMFSDGQTSEGNWFLPSDLWKGRTSIDIEGDGTYSMVTIDNAVDTETAWWSEIGEDDPYEPPFIISPYASDGSRNALADTAGQALADMDGASNTSVLVNLSAIKDTYTSGAFENVQANYPAAFACNLFSTVGTSQGDWYLPALGELAYLFVREGTINQSLAALGNSAVQVGNLTNATSSFGYWCWSSSEFSSNASWNVHANGPVNSYRKRDDDDNVRVRSFAAF